MSMDYKPKNSSATSSSSSSYEIDSQAIEEVEPLNKKQQQQKGKSTPARKSAIKPEVKLKLTMNNNSGENSFSGISGNSAKPDDMSSDEWEENMLINSYENYGKMISMQNRKKKQDKKIK